jgi:hypothetical protein
MGPWKSLALIGRDSARLLGCGRMVGRITFDKEDLKEAADGACRAMEVQAGLDGLGIGTRLRETREVGPGSERVEVAGSLWVVLCRRMSRSIRRFSAVRHTSAPACVDTLRSQLCIGLRKHYAVRGGAATSSPALAAAPRLRRNKQSASCKNTRGPAGDKSNNASSTAPTRGAEAAMSGRNRRASYGCHFKYPQNATNPQRSAAA